MINLKVKTLDSQTYDFTVDNETTVRQFKETIAEKTKISADLQRIIYCGRVLVDEKPLKEYDVNGKVVHVVERPPPPIRNLGSSSNTPENTRRRNGTQIRGSPIFRDLDGMLLGTMTIPMTGQSQANIPALNPSSFCMNRITVARHMLDCVNNIISYLEHPERGLNNSTLDILTQGRFTMESTVVEVGITAASSIDLSQNQSQNFMDVFRGALSAALRQDRRQNVTVLQLPSVFNADGTPVPNPGSNATISVQHSSDAPRPENAPEQSRVDENAGENSTNTSNMAGNTEPQTSHAPSAPASESADETTSNEPASTDATSESNRSNSARRSNSQQTTRTRALAEIVEQMRSVQTRFEPYVQQYYEILENEPQFEENDTTGRENSQRIFDRVSEAMHYMSHALHAISDLMLDLSQNTPRHLSCRPILVEQSGFVSSNNYSTSFMQPPSDSGISINLQPNNNNNNNSQTPQTQTSQTTSISPPGFNSNGNDGRATSTATPENSSNASSATTPIAGAANPQLQVARIIQAVVNSAPIDADLHVQINAPNLISLGIPIGAVVPNAIPLAAAFSAGSAAHANQQGSNTANATTSQPTVAASSASSSTTTNNSASNETENNQQAQPRVTTATHPTTSTQTRSTPRPQVHVANMPSSWSYRDVPEHLFSSFDRFLPCNSHHIRDSDQSANPNDTNANENNQPIIQNIVNPSMLHRIRPRPRVRDISERDRRPLLERYGRVVRTQPRTNRAANDEMSNNPGANQESNNNVANRSTQNVTATSTAQQYGGSGDEGHNLSNDELNIPMRVFGSNLTLRDLIEIAPNPNLLNRIRRELLTCIVNDLFGGTAISEENMTNAVNNFIFMLNDVLVFLPQFDLPDYDARASVENFLRNRMPFIINLINEDSSDEFGTRFRRELVQFAQCLLLILVTCVGRNNAELYLNQISQMFISSEIAEEEGPLRTLHFQLMMAVRRQLDVISPNSVDVQQYLVIRRPSADNRNSSTNATPMETDEVRQVPANNNLTLLSNSMLEVTGLALPNPNQRPADEPLPTISVGSEQWHNNFPEAWLPIITRDTERQRRQISQPPFSDAYISGMSAKRRKLISNTKSPTEVPHLIADGIKRVASVSPSQSSTSNNTASNLASSNRNVNDVAFAIANDTVTQSSYIEALRTSIQDRLKTDQNYDPKKFPNSSKYFSK